MEELKEEWNDKSEALVDACEEEIKACSKKLKAGDTVLWRKPYSSFGEKPGNIYFFERREIAAIQFRNSHVAVTFKAVDTPFVLQLWGSDEEDNLDSMQLLPLFNQSVDFTLECVRTVFGDIDTIVMCM
jgi:hypothetical protein